MHNNLYHIKAIPFLLWWSASAFFVWPLSVVALAAILVPTGMFFNILRPVPYTNDAVDTLFMFAMLLFGGVIIAAVVGKLQRWLLRTRLYWAADGWQFWTVLGGFMGALILGGLRLLMEITVGIYFADQWSVSLAMAVFMLVVSAAQWQALRHAVRDSWLWVLGNVVAGMVFGGLASQSNNYDIGPLYFMGAVLAQGIITGFVILYLFEKKLLPMQPEDADTNNERSKSVWDEAI